MRNDHRCPVSSLDRRSHRDVVVGQGAPLFVSSAARLQMSHCRPAGQSCPVMACSGCRRARGRRIPKTRATAAHGFIVRRTPLQQDEGPGEGQAWCDLDSKPGQIWPHFAAPARLTAHSPAKLTLRSTGACPPGHGADRNNDGRSVGIVASLLLSSSLHFEGVQMQICGPT